MKRYIRSETSTPDVQEIRNKCIDIFHEVVGDMWPDDELHETVYGCDEAYSLDTYTPEEAQQVIAELNSALKEAGLRKYITKIDSFGSALFQERPLRILMRFKKSVS